MSTLGSNGTTIRRTLTVAAIVLASVLVPALRAAASTGDEATSRSLVNSARSAAGLGALADESRLDEIARAQAERMVERDAIYHNLNLKAEADAAGVDWRWIGENVGVGPDVEAIHEGFMASPGHHENIVYGNYTVVGIGVAVGKDGSIFVAQVFAGLAPAAPLQPAPQQVAPAAPATAAVPSHVEPKAAPPQQTQPPAIRPEAPPSTPNALVGGIVNPETGLN